MVVVATGEQVYPQVGGRPLALGDDAEGSGAEALVTAQVLHTRQPSHQAVAAVQHPGHWGRPEHTHTRTHMHTHTHTHTHTLNILYLHRTVRQEIIVARVFHYQPKRLLSLIIIFKGPLVTMRCECDLRRFKIDM